MRNSIRYVARLAGFHLRQIRATARIDATIMAYVNIVVDDPTRLRIGKGTTVSPFTEINVTSRDGGRSGVYIGERVTVGMGCNLRGAGGIIEIGDAAQLGQHVSVIAANHQFDPDSLIRDQPWSTTTVDVRIESDAFIGCGSQVLPGVTIGRGAVVAAGSLVRESVPAWAIVAGVPARIVGSRLAHSASLPDTGSSAVGGPATPSRNGSSGAET